MPSVSHVNSGSQCLPHSAQGVLLCPTQYGSSDPAFDLPPDLVQAGWGKFWSRRENRPYFFNSITNESLWEIPIVTHARMELVYDKLRINICSILRSVSDETVNDIICAIQNAGFESLSDLQFIQEEDLMFILKPIPQRKLVKEWKKPSIVEELECEYERMKNKDVSRQIEKLNYFSKNSFESITNPEAMENITGLLKTNISGILNLVSEETLNDIIHALKYVGFEFLLDLQFVREDDLMQVLKPIQRRKLVKAWSQQGILFHFPNASALSHEPITADFNIYQNSSTASSLLPCTANCSTPDLSIFARRQASIGSSHITISQPLSNQFSPYTDQRYGPFPDRSSEVSSLSDQFYARLPSGPPPEGPNLGDQFYAPLPPGPPPEDCAPLPPGPPPEISGLTSNAGKNSFSSTVPPNNVNCSNSDLSIFDQSEASLESSHMDTSQLSLNELSPYMFQIYDPLPPGTFSGVFSFFLNDDYDGSCPIFPDSKFKGNKSSVLLELYAKYKTELAYSSVERKHEVWKKIAEEISKRCSFKCNELRCINKIKELKREFYALKGKPENMCSPARIIFFNEAKNSFETSGNSGTTFAELSSSVSFPRFKWVWKSRLALLRLYSIYKTELSSTNINKKSVWQKIIEKIGKSLLQSTCNVKQCCDQIHKMKCEYERMKSKKPYEAGPLQAVFLDEAENAFENIENPVLLSLESDLRKWTMNKPDSLKLLKVYTKYKEELLLMNFDVERQIVWGKVSREISKKCSAHYGKRLCCYMIHFFKKQYEIYKTKNVKNGKKPYFFDEAKKIFESAECPDQHEKVNSVTDITVKQEKSD